MKINFFLKYISSLKGYVFIQNYSILVNMQCISRLDFINLFNFAEFSVPSNGLASANLAQKK